RASIPISVATTCCASLASPRTSASTESAICFSASPPISASSRVISCRSISKALVVCSWVAICVILLAMLPEAARRCSPGDVVLGTVVAWRRASCSRYQTRSTHPDPCTAANPRLFDHLVGAPEQRDRKKASRCLLTTVVPRGLLLGQCG